MFPPTGSGGEVASLDNTGWKEDLGVFQMNDLQTGRTLQITCSGRSEGLRAFNAVELTVDDQNLLGSLLLGQSIEDGIHGLTKNGAICGDFFRGAKVFILERAWFDVVQDIASNVGLPAALLEVLESGLDWDHIMGVVAALDVRKPLRENVIVSDTHLLMCTRDAHRGHQALGDNGSWPIMVDNLHETTPEGIDILSLDSHNLEAVTLKGLGEIISLEVTRGVSSDGDVIIVDEKFDVEILSNCQPSGFRIVTLLLRSVGTQTEHGFVAIGQGNAVDHGPHMPETSGGEFDSGSQAQLRVTGKLGVGSTVVEKVFGGDGSLKGREQVLSSDTVTWVGVNIFNTSAPCDGQENVAPASSKKILTYLSEPSNSDNKIVTSGMVS